MAKKKPTKPPKKVKTADQDNRAAINATKKRLTKKGATGHG